MFKYRKCTGKKINNFINGRSAWEITFPNGSKDFAFDLQIALMLCDGRLKHN